MSYARLYQFKEYIILYIDSHTIICYSSVQIGTDITFRHYLHIIFHTICFLVHHLFAHQMQEGPMISSRVASSAYSKAQYPFVSPLWRIRRPKYLYDSATIHASNFAHISSLKTLAARLFLCDCRLRPTGHDRRYTTSCPAGQRSALSFQILQSNEAILSMIFQVHY